MSNRLFSDEEFDQNFNMVTKTVKRGFMFAFAVIAVQVLVGLAVLGGLAYVAIHFLHKVW